MKLRVPTEDQVFPQRQAYTLPMSGSLSTTRSGFCYRAAKLFNSLPLNLRECCSENAFKNEAEKWVKENIKIEPPYCYKSIIVMLSFFTADSPTL